VNVRRRLCALLLLALWLPYYAHCIEPHCMNLALHEHACDLGEAGEHGESAGACHQHDPARPAPNALKVAPAPVAEVLLSQLMELLPRPVCAEPSGPAELVELRSDPPLQTFLVRTAQPVRGPTR
jgi:hypothetical protein